MTWQERKIRWALFVAHFWVRVAIQLCDDDDDQRTYPILIEINGILTTVRKERRRKTDPTYGRIAPDIQQMVDDMHPRDVAQRVALENSAQALRDAAAGRPPWEGMGDPLMFASEEEPIWETDAGYGSHEVAVHAHVHRDGVCIKNRYGPRCA